MKIPFLFPLRNTAVCSLLAAVAVTGAQAASGTWTQLSGGSATGTWSDAVTSTWAGGVVAGGSGFTADFSTLNPTVGSTITLGAPRTIGNMIFGDTDITTAAGWAVAGTGANTLTLAGATPTITVNALNSNSLVSITTSIGGTDGLTKAGVGILSLSGSNTYSGGTFVTSGTLRASSSFALGAGAVTVTSGAGLQFGNTITVGNAINLNGSGTSGALSVSTGTATLTGNVTLQSASTINVSQGSTALELSGTLVMGANTLSSIGTQRLILNGPIVGSGTLNLTSPAGFTSINNDNSSTFSGAVVVSRSTLAVGHNGALGTGALIFGQNDQPSTIRSTDTTTRTLANAVTLVGSANSTFVFGSTTASVNGNLTFSNTTAISVGASNKRLVVNNTTQFDAGFTGGFGLIVQTGTGTLILNGVNTYTGATTVNAGTLLVNGSLASGSVVTSGTGTTLGGTGTIGGNTTVNGILAPGASTESLAFGGNLTLANTTNAIFEINGINRGSLVNGYDAIDLTNGSGILTYDGTLTLTMSGLVANGTYDLFSFTAAATGSFDAINFAGGAYTGTFIQSGSLWTATSAQGQVFTFDQTTGDLTVVPEPTTAVLLGTGLMTALFLRRRQRQS
jgi:autotransporter-associated beta strand protein